MVPVEITDVYTVQADILEYTMNELAYTLEFKVSASMGEIGHAYQHTMAMIKTISRHKDHLRRLSRPVKLPELPS